MLAYQVHVHVCIDFIWKMQRCVGLKDLQLAITLEEYLFYQVLGRTYRFGPTLLERGHVGQVGGTYPIPVVQ